MKGLLKSLFKGKTQNLENMDEYGIDFMTLWKKITPLTIWKLSQFSKNGPMADLF